MTSENALRRDDELQHSKKKKRKRQEEKLQDDDEIPEQRKKNKKKSSARELASSPSLPQTTSALPVDRDNPAASTPLLNHSPAISQVPHVPLDDGQDESTSPTELLAAIVAAATGVQPSADQSQHSSLAGESTYNASDPSILSTYPDFESTSDGLIGSNELVLRALQDLDVSKLTSVLKTLEEAAASANVALPPHFLDPIAPSPVNQRPVSSQAILNMADCSYDGKTPNANPAQFTSEDHAHILATKWLDTKRLKTLVDEQGLVYKKGKFSAIEEQQVKSAIENYRMSRSLNEEDIDHIIFPKNDKNRDNAFWSEITLAVPQRPVISVYQYVRRAYHPMKRQGKWVPAEDDRLRQAVSSLGQQWEKISQIVGRRPADCRDRYRNHLVNREFRVSGPWTKEEEDELTRIVTEMTVMQGRDIDDEVFWGKVSERMGGRRARQQCRIKWTDCLSKLVKSDGDKTRWSSKDAYILVRKIDSLNVRDDTEIDWKTIPDENWNLWSPHVIQRRWQTMKRSINGYKRLTMQEILDILKQKKGTLPASDSHQARQMHNETD